MDGGAYFDRGLSVHGAGGLSTSTTLFAISVV
jgi:hypothetical protein